MIFYLDSVDNFLSFPYENILATLEDSFKKYKSKWGYELDPSEKNSWKENYLAMKSVLDHCAKKNIAINDCQILIEYNIPEIPKRIDYVFVGKYKGKIRTILCELKQWDEVWYVSEKKADSVYVNFYFGDELHPAAQLKDYEKELELSNVCKDTKILKCCYLYNLPKNKKIIDKTFDHLLKDCEIFFKNKQKEKSDFSEWLAKCFDGGASKAEVESILK